MSPPTANSFQNNELIHVYALGTDSAIWRRRLGGASWSDSDSLGGSSPQYGRAPTKQRPDEGSCCTGHIHAVRHFEFFDP